MAARSPHGLAVATSATATTGAATSPSPARRLSTFPRRIPSRRRSTTPLSTSRRGMSPVNTIRAALPSVTGTSSPGTRSARRDTRCMLHRATSRARKPLRSWRLSRCRHTPSRRHHSARPPVSVRSRVTSVLMATSSVSLWRLPVPPVPRGSCYGRGRPSTAPGPRAHPGDRAVDADGLCGQRGQHGVAHLAGQPGGPGRQDQGPLVSPAPGRGQPSLLPVGGSRVLGAPRLLPVGGWPGA